MTPSTRSPTVGLVVEDVLLLKADMLRCWVLGGGRLGRERVGECEEEVDDIKRACFYGPSLNVSHDDAGCRSRR